MPYKRNKKETIKHKKNDTKEQDCPVPSTPASYIVQSHGTLLLQHSSISSHSVPDSACNPQGEELSKPETEDDDAASEDNAATPRPTEYVPRSLRMTHPTEVKIHETKLKILD